MEVFNEIRSFDFKYDERFFIYSLFKIKYRTAFFIKHFLFYID